MTSTDNIKKSKKGRPQVDTTALTLRLSNELLERLDAHRRTLEDLPNRQEAIRRLLEAELP
ncbi:ribbon-helix-helix protein, CopG family [Henriciella aquimarina]|uniref:ribbon-helix-helix protein, CopG family n=1 Tax=Henriciella aquimarina TaxID=545261 RepID=UPI001179A15A